MLGSTSGGLGGLAGGGGGGGSWTLCGAGGGDIGSNEAEEEARLCGDIRDPCLGKLILLHELAQSGDASLVSSGGGGGGGFSDNGLSSRGSTSGVAVENELSLRGECEVMDKGGVGKCVKNLGATAGSLCRGAMPSSSFDPLRGGAWSLCCFTMCFNARK